VKEIFLSASIPMPGRGSFHETANPFLIQFAVRELLTVCLGRRRIVWGGHPAITPMVWAVCEDLGVEYARAVLLYQSRFFEEFFPEENRRFTNVVYVDRVGNDRQKSLELMRRKMLNRKDMGAAVFIGGMEGIFEELSMFQEMHPKAQVLAVSSPGGAALEVAKRTGQFDERIDFARLFHEKLHISINEPRDQVGHDV
jgi:hypothetical protein